jgi:hypothetical protein
MAVSGSSAIVDGGVHGAAWLAGTPTRSGPPRAAVGAADGAAGVGGAVGSGCGFWAVLVPVDGAEPVRKLWVHNLGRDPLRAARMLLCCDRVEALSAPGGPVVLAVADRRRLTSKADANVRASAFMPGRCAVFGPVLLVGGWRADTQAFGGVPLGVLRSFGLGVDAAPAGGSAGCGERHVLLVRVESSSAAVLAAVRAAVDELCGPAVRAGAAWREVLPVFRRAR